MSDNIIIVGMPGSGKTTVGSMVARALGREFYDVDEYYKKKFGVSAAEHITENGEDFFRDRESDVIKELCGMSGVVISAGGGSVIRDENRKNMRENGFVVWIKRDLDKLPDGGRPMSLKKGVETLYKEREKFYKDASDIEIDNNGDVDKTVDMILASVGDLRV